MEVRRRYKVGRMKRLLMVWLLVVWLLVVSMVAMMSIVVRMGWKTSIVIQS